jgi:hypothetical protein
MAGGVQDGLRVAKHTSTTKVAIPLRRRAPEMACNEFPMLDSVAAEGQPKTRFSPAHRHHTAPLMVG